jgi:hypothetical protein
LPGLPSSETKSYDVISCAMLCIDSFPSSQCFTTNTARVLLGRCFRLGGGPPANSALKCDVHTPASGVVDAEHRTTAVRGFFLGN